MLWNPVLQERHALRAEIYQLLTALARIGLSAGLRGQNRIPGGGEAIRGGLAVIPGREGQRPLPFSAGVSLAETGAGNPLPEGEGRVRGRPFEASAEASPLLYRHQLTCRELMTAMSSGNWSRGLHLTPAPLLTGEGFPAPSQPRSEEARNPPAAQYSHSAPTPTEAEPSAPVSAWTFRRRVTSIPIETPLSSGLAPAFTPIETLLPI
ncbi:hypothetical protein SAMN05216304_101162 [Bosea sp. OK403]|nr:hypothetical protein SAMN05216304_101162 [Bosea sp. OK403]